MQRRLHVWITGRVQGVSFRYHARVCARRLGLTGWVRNLADGRVELVAEGAPEQLRALLDWCGEGPAAARVDRVEHREGAASGEFEGFAVVRDGG
jgi:acylphosphatase